MGEYLKNTLKKDFEFGFEEEVEKPYSRPLPKDKTVKRVFDGEYGKIFFDRDKFECESNAAEAFIN